MRYHYYKDGGSEEESDESVSQSDDSAVVYDDIPKEDLDILGNLLREEHILKSFKEQAPDAGGTITAWSMQFDGDNVNLEIHTTETWNRERKNEVMTFFENLFGEDSILESVEPNRGLFLVPDASQASIEEYTPEEFEAL